MFRVGIVTNKGRIDAQNFNTRDEVDNFILSFDKDELLLHFRISEDGKVIETERGKQ